MSRARGERVTVDIFGGYVEARVVDDRGYYLWVRMPDGLQHAVPATDVYDPLDLDEQAPPMIGVVLVGAVALLSLVVVLSIAAHLAGPPGFFAAALAAASGVYTWRARRAEQGDDPVAANRHLWLAWLVCLFAVACSVIGWGWPR